MGNIIQMILNLFGQGDKAKIGGLIMSVLLGGNKQGAMSSDGAAAGGSSSPLGGLMEQFKNKGMGDIVKSWVGSGENQQITPEQVKEGIGHDKLNEMAQKSGLSVSDLASKLSKYLPGVIDKLTPSGKLPGQ